MKIKYLGHSCFVVTSNQYSIVLDPFKDVNGFENVCLSCNEAICSHKHGDHCYIEELNIVKKQSPFIVDKVESFHDDDNGNKRGKNNITILKAENKKIVHLGDLGHILNNTQIELLKNTDVLMIPVGGFYTINAFQARKIIDDLNPKNIIPMHYRDGQYGLSQINSIDEFLLLCEDIKDRLLLVKGYNKEIDY